MSVVCGIEAAAGGASVVGAIDPVVTVVIDRTLGAQIGQLVADLAPAHTRVAGRSATALCFAVFDAVTEQAIVRAMGIVGAKLTKPAYAGIVGTADAVITIAIDGAHDTLAVCFIANLAARQTGIATGTTVAHRVAELSAAAEAAIVRAAQVVGGKGTGAGQAGIGRTSDAIVTVTVEETSIATVGVFVANLAQGAGVSFGLATQGQNTMFWAVTEVAIGSTKAVLGANYAAARLASVFGASDAIVAVAVNQTLIAAVVILLAEFRCRAGVPGGDTTQMHMAKLAAIAVGAVVGALAAVGGGDTDAALTTINGASDPIVAVGIGQALAADVEDFVTE